MTTKDATPIWMYDSAMNLKTKDLLPMTLKTQATGDNLKVKRKTYLGELKMRR